MKKTAKSLFILSFILLLLVACTSQAPLNPINEVENEAESETEGSQVETSTELIPSDEWAILKNEPKLYEGRPLADVPVEVYSVERYSDRVVIEASLYETRSGHDFTLVQEGSETDIINRDPLYINGVVRNEIDTKTSWPSSATKVELTSYEKVESADLIDPVVASRQIDMTLENELFSANIEKVDVGDKFTRIYFTPTPKDQDNYIGRFEATIITSEGEFPLLDKGEASTIRIRAHSLDTGREALVFDKVDISNGFTLKLTGLPRTWYSEEPLVPLVFDVR